MSGDRLLYVVAIGAPTNVSSALLAALDIADRIVVVWLGGNPTAWHPAAEYNLQQDPAASRVLFDSGVPLVYVPCVNVTEHLRTTTAEVDRYIRPSGAIGQYLADIYVEHCGDVPGRSKVLWDIGAIACLCQPGLDAERSHPQPDPYLRAHVELRSATAFGPRAAWRAARSDLCGPIWEATCQLPDPVGVMAVPPAWRHLAVLAARRRNPARVISDDREAHVGQRFRAAMDALPSGSVLSTCDMSQRIWARNGQSR